MEKVEVPAFYFQEGPCLVQGWLQPGAQSVREVRSPSVQIFVNGQRQETQVQADQLRGSIRTGPSSVRARALRSSCAAYLAGRADARRRR